VKLKSHARNVTDADLIAFCKENMAHFKVPKYVIFGEIQKTATGKIQKFSLRELARTLSETEK
jgi:fatty-acyl-CoA synthase